MSAPACARVRAPVCAAVRSLVSAPVNVPVQEKDESQEEKGKLFLLVDGEW